VVSPIHSLDPRAKILCALAVVLTIVLLPPLPLLAFVALFLVLMAVTLLARLPVGYVLGRAALVLPFAGTIAFLAPLSAAGGSLNWAGITGAYSNGGWAIAYGVLGKAWLSVFVVVLLSATTPVPKLFRALQALRLPDIFLTMLSFVYRYVGAMRDQITSMRRALDSRAPGLSRRGRVRLYGHLAGNMFLRSYERGERVYAAMVSRGYDGSLPSSDLLRLGGGDAVLAAATLTCIAVLVAFSATGSVIL
jgi:cobalt/nickel transport system permease protein